jgi:RimJ/RimL family protein N-acetyltransferase
VNEPVGPIRIEGERVVLRPVRPDEFEAVWQARQGLDPSTQPVMPEREALRRRMDASGYLVEGALDLGIEAEGRLIGGIQTYVPPTGRPLPPGVFELGIGLDSETVRGKGYGTEAVRLLVGWLFEHAGAVRVQSPTVPSNAAMRRVFDKLGFRIEGTIREFDQDFIVYALTASPARSGRS